MRPDQEGIFRCSDKNLTTVDVDAIIYAFSDKERAAITYISLERNQLDAVPESISTLTNLENLFLSGNRIEQLPEWIGNLTSLTWLGVQCTNLQTLPRSICNLIHLKCLHLQSNYHLGMLPSSMVKLTNLMSLSLHNCLFRLPEHLQRNAHIQEDTQQLLREIAMEEWRVKTSEATVAWMLGGQQTGVHRDVRNMIARMIYATHREEVWEDET